MKKLFVLLLIIFTILPSFSLAEIDLTSLSYDELVSLKSQVELAIWQCEEWQEVEVPKGVYVVGQQIPAGKWTIKAADSVNCYIKWGDLLDDSGVDVSWEGRISESEVLYSPNYRYYQKGDATEVAWELRTGDYFIVEDGIALFTPYAGAPSLGFK